jgi:peptide/nickel transport system ATP-binding protein/oligopeptide transport system ATP-binding protein
VRYRGRDVFGADAGEMKALRREMQIIFQDPYGSLDPRMPVSDIVGEGLVIHGVLDRRARERAVRDALDAVGLRPEYGRRYPHEFSGGQRQRIGIARALVLQPRLLICDEPVSALDVSIQSQVLNLLKDLQREFGLTYLFIAHNLAVVRYISDRVAVMYLGKVVELAPAEELYREPRMPYTIALLSAIPQPDPRQRRKRIVLSGEVPSPVAPPSGCRFRTRCWMARERCVTEEPAWREIRPGHWVACHFAEETA